MKPIVLLGGGIFHYQIIQAMREEDSQDQPILLVSEKPKLTPIEFLPYQLSNSAIDVSLDLWTACQRKSVEYLEDRCLQINKDEGTIQLENFGHLAFKHLSLETDCEPRFEISAHDDPSKIKLENPNHFTKKLRQFFQEVHRHCPREVRVVLTGLSQFSLELSLVIQNKLKRDCENCDVVILEERSFESLTSAQKKQVNQLKKRGIRVLSKAQVLSDKPHCLELQGGQALSYDILIPLNHWTPRDFLGRLLQSDTPFIEVEENLCHISHPSVSIVGRNVFMRTKKRWLNDFSQKDITETLLHNIFIDEGKKKRKVSERVQRFDCTLLGERWDGLIGRSEEKILLQWQKEKSHQLGKLRSVPVFSKAHQNVDLKLQQQADQMSRPWRGISSQSKTRSQKYFLTTFHGFNSWGNYTQSTLKICEIALLKSLSLGMEAKQLRFNLTLPSVDKRLSRPIFESTLNNIESFCNKQGLEMDGGDTFDGSFWKLGITLGGESILNVGQKMNSHDYLLMTRPLGYGVLWAGRLQEGFDSQWIQESLEYPLLFDSDDFQIFIEKHKVSAAFVIEEWGFLYHCLRHTPAHQQMILNFREIPRWEGTDTLFNKQVSHPGFEINWPKVESEVAFKRNDVSATNSVLWDSMSQGSLVFGVPPQNWQEALTDLKKLGYNKAALVGCTRPKKSGQRVVLSDWSP